MKWRSDSLKLRVPKLSYSYYYRKKWLAMCELADDRIIIIKKADKDSAIVVWDCNGNILKA